MTIESILKLKKCGDVFPNNKNEAKKLYKKLVLQFHPDKNSDPKASDAISILNTLYDEAMDCFKKGVWLESDVLYLISKDEKKYKFNYSDKIKFELGNMYYSKRNVFYVLDKDKEKYYNNYIAMTSKLKYKNNDMKKEFSRYFPTNKKNISFQCKDGKYVIVINKTEDSIPLFKIINNIPKEHQAWIISRLSNIACYFNYNGIAHNGISINNCFISPKYHSIMIYGGWWYAKPFNEKMIGTEKFVYDTMPIVVKSNKKSNIQTDLESIRKIGRKISTSDTPKPMLKWYNLGSSEDSNKEFSNWMKVLEQSFGKRRFVEWKIDVNQYY